MKLEFMHKTRLSNSGDCPALYRTDRGTYVVQGWRVTDPQALSMVRDLAEGETVVEIPADVLDRDLMAAWKHVPADPASADQPVAATR